MNIIYHITFSFFFRADPKYSSASTIRVNNVYIVVNSVTWKKVLIHMK